VKARRTQDFRKKAGKDTNRLRCRQQFVLPPSFAPINDSCRNSAIILIKKPGMQAGRQEKTEPTGWTIDERGKFAYHALGKEPPVWKRSAC
jgi:hypothetical protein